MVRLRGQARTDLRFLSPLILIELCVRTIVFLERKAVKRRLILAALLCASAAGLLDRAPVHGGRQAKGPQRWESAIAEFEAEDRANPPAEDGIIFLGSSSIRMWDVKKWFPGLPVVNRGFGGSQIADSLFYAERIVVPPQAASDRVLCGRQRYRGR